MKGTTQSFTSLEYHLAAMVKTDFRGTRLCCGDLLRGFATIQKRDDYSSYQDCNQKYKDGFGIYFGDKIKKSCR